VKVSQSVKCFLPPILRLSVHLGKEQRILLGTALVREIAELPFNGPQTGGGAFR